MKAIPVVVRERIVQLCEEGRDTAEIAAFWGYCEAALRRVRQQFKARGTLIRRCGRKTLLTPARVARLRQRVADRPDATLAELGRGWTAPTWRNKEAGDLKNWPPTPLPLPDQHHDRRNPAGRAVLPVSVRRRDGR